MRGTKGERGDETRREQGREEEKREETRGRRRGQEGGKERRDGRKKGLKDGIMVPMEVEMDVGSEGKGQSMPAHPWFIMHDFFAINFKEIFSLEESTYS